MLNHTVIEGCFHEDGTLLNFVGTKKAANKTFVVEINNKDDFYLGDLKWRGGWRKYAFYPAPNVAFDNNHLYEIIQFAQKLTKDKLACDRDRRKTNDK